MDIQLQSTLSGHQNPIYSLVCDESQHILYSAGNDKGIVEWDLTTKQFKRVLCAVPASVYALKLIAGTDYLLAALRTGGLMVIAREEPRLIAKLEVDKGAVFAMAVLTKKQELMAIDEYGKAYVWSLANFELLYSFQVSTTTVRSVAVQDEKGIVAFGDKDGVIRLFNSADFQEIVKVKVHQQSVASLAFLGEYLYSGGRDAKMYKLNLSDLSVVSEVTPHMFTVYGIVPIDERLLATVSRDKTIKIWNTELKLQKNVSRDKGLDSHYLSINSMAYDSVAKILCTAGDDKMIKVWEIS